MLILIRPRPAAWLAFAVVLGTDVPYLLAVRHTVAEALYVVAGQTAFVGIATYGLARLAGLVGALHAGRAGLAKAGVEQARLDFTARINDRLGNALSRIVLRGELALRLMAEDPARMTAEARDCVAVARAALTDMREVSHGYRDALSRPAIVVTDTLSTARIGTLRDVALVLMIVPLPVREMIAEHYPPLRSAAFLLTLAAFVALYGWNCRPWRGTIRPRGWVLTLLAQVALCYLPLLPFDGAAWSVRMYLAGLVLVLLPGRWRWLLGFLLLFQDAPFGVWGSDAWDIFYNLVWVAERAAVVYGLARAATLATELRSVRAALAEVEVAREQLRFARDLHDLLGYGLSAVVLKMELAVRLAARDGERAAAEFAGGLDVARQALADVDAVTSGYRDLSLAEELDSARSVLAAAGVEADIDVTVGGLPADRDTVLATVLREGVTNVLRHSSARRCVIRGGIDGETVRLRITNDGVPVRPEQRPGSGIANLGTRAAALGGRLVSGAADGEFTVTVELPLPV